MVIIFLHNDKVERNGGGVGIYVKNNINMRIRDDIGITDTFFIEVLNTNHGNIIIIVAVYKPPNGDFHSFHDSIIYCLEVISAEK